MSTELALAYVLETVNALTESEIDFSKHTDRSLWDLGIDSLTYIHMIVCLEDGLGIRLPDECLVMGESVTLELLAEYIDTRGSFK